MKIVNANIVSAFSDVAVGTRVTNPAEFMGLVLAAVANFAAQKIPGQGFIMLPESAIAHVSAGVGKRTRNPADFVSREYRGKVTQFLKRENAEKVTGCAVVVDTREAYLADPEVNLDEASRISADVTHVLVCVLAFAGPKSPLSPDRFISNLAGGNNEALAWSADEIRKMSVEVKAYDDVWSVVAD